MAKRGRQGDGGGVQPATLTSDQAAEVEKLAAVLSAEQIADYLGVGRTTFFRIMDRQPEVAERYKKGRSKALGAVANGLLREALDGNIAAAMFYLKTQGGWRETTRTEVTGAEGGPVQHEDVTHDAAAFARRMAGLAARAVAGRDGEADASGAGGA